MTQREFVIVYVALPLAVALGWLLWRGRLFLRNLLIYTIAVVVLVALVRAGGMAWNAWDSWWHPVAAAPLADRPCLAPGVTIRPGSRDSCWT
ncbi:MAG: hypothetical protein QOH05_1794 [Acetobacteraceae bacterium]|jgi:hypothetical protein|nr:hypothetical protein [Acetobacteraceae bacterium]